MNQSLARQDTVVYTVSELNASIKTVLESKFPLVWVKGEISNLRIPSSGHCYFTLKDDQSQIRAVFFKTQQRHLRFSLESGIQVLCQCRLGVYEPRGEYQLIVEIMEPLGRGALQLAFEQLKKKLEAEGLFDPKSKLPLPVNPQRIAIITSPTGAAIRDILTILQRSPFPLHLSLLPVRVQGEGAGSEIARAIEAVNSLDEQYSWDLMIIGRGGGSLEDLWPFNEEQVARAIFSSHIPVISAVGHETDLTISDFVADLRAPTPTAAAEWVVRRLVDLQGSLVTFHERIHRSILHCFTMLKHRLHFLGKRLLDPRRKLQDLRLALDDRFDRLHLSINRLLERLRTDVTHLSKRLTQVHPAGSIYNQKALVNKLSRELVVYYHHRLEQLGFSLKESLSRLQNLNPLSVLARGYSITYRSSDGRIVRSFKDVERGSGVYVRLSSGVIECTVLGTFEETSQLERGKK